MDFVQQHIKYKIKYFKLKQQLNIQSGGGNNKRKEKKLKELRKIYKEQIKKIDYIHIQLKPFLSYVDEDSEYIPIKNNINSNLEKIFKKKLKKNYKNIITDNMLHYLKNIKYQYDPLSNIVNIYVKPDIKYILANIYDFSYTPHEIKDVLNLYAWNIYYEIEDGEHHWLDGDATYIKVNEYDKKEYILFANFYSASIHYDNKSKTIGYKCDKEGNNFKQRCVYYQ
jgi:hypothetical protein